MKGCGEKGTLIDCWWDCELVLSLWLNSTDFPQKILKRPDIWSIHFSSEYLPKANKNTNFYTHTHRSITQPWKIKSNLALCDNMNGCRGHYSKWNKWNRKINTTWSNLYVEPENRLIDAESKGIVTREGMVKGIKRYILNHGNVIYSIRTMVNNIVIICMETDGYHPYLYDHFRICNVK